MKHKYNPWVSLVALVLLALILVFTCTGCTAEAEAATDDGRRPVISEITEETGAAVQFGTRFEVDFESYGWPYMNGIYVITDNQTGVQYLACEMDTGLGLCKLED